MTGAAGDGAPDDRRTIDHADPDPGRSLRRLARVSAIVAGVSGLGGALFLLGTFGGVSCTVSSTLGSGSTSSGGAGPTATTDRVTATTEGATAATDRVTATSEAGRETIRECVAGIDYLNGVGGNAPVLFFWAMVLVAITVVGSASAWTGHRHATWAATIAGAVVTVLGVFSVGWFFLLPTIALLTASFAWTAEGFRRWS